MALVVRCPGCRGASQVDETARGLTVQCPLCSDTFVAVPEATLVAPARTDRTTTSPVPSRSRGEAESPLPRRRSEEAERPRLTDRNKPRSSNEPEHDHDPHRHPTGGLPASVLIGLALLPFVIPILWLIAPAAFGQRPHLSVAVPLAIALSASILSLAVIYTIDWSPQVRVKGVLMLVGLAYFFSISFFFLKPEMVDWVKTFFGRKWITFSHPSAPMRYSVVLPKFPEKDAGQPVPGMRLECYKLIHTDTTGTHEFVVAIDLPPPKDAKRPDRDFGSEDWFERTKNMIAADLGQIDPDVPYDSLDELNGKGRQFGIKVAAKNAVRIVHIYVINGRVYYLSIEREGLTEKDEYARTFFSSFHVSAGKK